MEPDDAARPRPGSTDASPDAGDLDQLLSMLAPRLTDNEMQLVRDAHHVADEAHRGQVRASGEPYISHPLEVARILAQLELDAPTIAAGLLHDVVEDTPLTQADVEARFGPEVGLLVAGMTKISAIEAREQQSSEAENLRRMLLAAVDDLRVILVKLADRLHNMRTLHALSETRQRRMARETLEIYAPLANRLGIWHLKSEFEDLALGVLEPEAYTSIERELVDRRHKHEAYLEDVSAQLREELRAHDISADISSRTKHIYSIYRKMQRKGVAAEDVYDVLAVRVIVDSVQECYLAVGVAHTLWAPIKGEFDDYIAKRKSNLYQSLHTSVHGPGNRPLEIQIRTVAMDEVAEYGVAAHWKYKERGQQGAAIEEKIASLRRLLQSQDEEALNAEDFVEGLKTDVFKDQVYVFTPQGQVKELPAGSTPIDFAYHIHTEVGQRCRGAMVDDRMVPLDTPLETGQTVKIITTKGDAGPSRDWLNPALGYVASSRAQSKISQWFRRQARQQAIRDGRDVVERQLRKLGLTRIGHDDVARQFEYESLDEFLAAVGRHDIPGEKISARLLEASEPPDERATQGPQTEGRPRQATTAVTDAEMYGTSGLHMRAAACCHPVPGDDVVGYITRGRGVTLHRETCHNIARLLDREPNRFIKVTWPQSTQQRYPIELKIDAYDRPGLLRDISEVLSRRNTNMSSMQASVDRKTGTAIVSVIVEIPSYSHLTSLIDILAAIDNVVDVHRPEG